MRNFTKLFTYVILFVFILAPQNHILKSLEP